MRQKQKLTQLQQENDKKMSKKEDKGGMDDKFLFYPCLKSFTRVFCLLLFKKDKSEFF